MYDIETLEKICYIVRKVDGNFAKLITEADDIYDKTGLKDEDLWRALNIITPDSSEKYSVWNLAEKDFFNQPLFAGIKKYNMFSGIPELWITEDMLFKNVPQDTWKEMCSLMSEHYSCSSGLFQIAKMDFRDRTFSIETNPLKEWTSRIPYKIKAPEMEKLPEEYQILLKDLSIRGRLKAGITGIKNHNDSVLMLIKMLFWGKKTKKIVRNSLERIEANAINTYKDDVRMYKNDLRLKELFDQYLYIVTKEIEFKKEDIRKYLLQIGFKEKK